MEQYFALRENSVFLEVGSFKHYGGWVLDTQFILNMGSAYLLAHGLGNPVSDATTTAEFPRPGKYRLWAFTKDWVAHWKQGMAPGVFQIAFDGQVHGTVFGNEGDAWHWQDGGLVEVTSCSVSVALKDLTGFEGRCGALFFTQELDFVPPDKIDELTVFRRILCGNEGTEDFGEYDIVVAGAGIAGMCAAVASARNGLRVAFVHDREIVGGNNSSEVRVWLGGKTNFEPYPKVGNLVNEFEQENMAHYGPDNVGELYDDERKISIIRREKNIDLFTGFFVIGAKAAEDVIKQVTLYNVKTGSYGRIKAGLFADCTGDGTLGYFAGAHYEITTNGHMGMTNYWNVKETDSEQTFPRCPWAIDLSGANFPGRGDPQNSKWLGCWFWESGMEHHPIDKAEYARDTNFRAMYGAWDCLKNTDKNHKNYRLNHSSYIGGKRESRRLFGDIILSKSDVLNDTVFPDGVVPSTWNFDVHYPKRQYYPAFYEGDAFITQDYHEKFNTPFFIPYRCLYSRNVKNLFMAGRNISVTHDALGTVRVMRTGGMMGEVIGVAAAICKEHNVFPRDVYETYLSVFTATLKK